MTAFGKLLRRASAVVLSLLCMMMLPGCWNSKDIQNLAYVTAIGVDYKDNHYITYVQVLNFSNIARTEGVQIGKTVPIWIGKGEGSSLVDSLDSILATSQQPVFWGHVKAVVITENLMRKGVVEMYSSLNRYREIRYSLFVFGTKERMEDIFTKKSLLNMSPLDTIMYSPEQVYSQHSFILPLHGNQVIARLNEPGRPTMLPSLTITKEVWKEDTKRVPLLRVSGAYFFNDKVLSGWMSSDDLKGTRWVQPKLEQAFLQVPNEDAPAATLNLSKPKYHIQPVVHNGSVYYDLSIRVRAKLTEILDKASIPELEKMAQETIRREVRETYDKGLEANCDVFKLEQTLYRNYPKVWNSRNKTMSNRLSKDSLRHIEVKVSILNTGKYKGRYE